MNLPQIIPFGKCGCVVIAFWSLSNICFAATRTTRLDIATSRVMTDNTYEIKQGQAGVQLKMNARLKPFVATFSPGAICFVETTYGRIEVGNGLSAAKMLDVNGFTFTRILPANLYLIQDLNLSPKVFAETIVSANLPSDQSHLDFYLSRPIKLTYVSPVLEFQKNHGLRAAASFVPSTNFYGIARGFYLDDSFATVKQLSTYKAAYPYQNLGQFAVVYAGDVQKVLLKLGARFELSTQHTGAEYGVNLSYFGVTIGASYGGSTEDRKKNRRDYKSLGLGYTIGPFGVSLGQFYSHAPNAEQKLARTSLSADYRVDKRIQTYIELSSARLASSNPKYGVIFGIKIK